jgi:BirA family transcriptional regulator, biotin operon repressor / biotin---[acetyl-CoA-carboxylase] ligase
VEDVKTDERDARVDKVALRKALGDRLIGHRLLYFLTLTSTNDHVRELAEDGWPEGTVVLSEEQTSGKGRSGRRWHSPPGLGLYLSVLLKPSLPGERIPLLTLMTAVAVTRGLRDAGHEAIIKWPNDILLGGRKIAGILADARLRPGVPPEVVVGLGINVNHRDEDFPPDLLPRAGSMRLSAGRLVDRTETLTRILIRLDEAYSGLRAGGDASLIETFLSLCPMARGAAVRVTGDGEPVEGRTAGLTPTGALKVATAGGVKEIRVGEVSVTESGDAPRM